MPRLWLANVEEVASAADVLFESVMVLKVDNLVPRFLFCLAPEDRLAASAQVAADFQAYVAAVSGLVWPRPLLIVPAIKSSPYSLVDSLMNDPGCMRELGLLARQGGWTLEPYFQSAKVLSLARAAGIPMAGSAADVIERGVVTNLNNKSYFKPLASRHGVPTVPGYHADNVDDLRDAIRTVSEQNADRVMIKKSLWGGGLGNLSGAAEELLSAIDSWYNQGQVLVEPLLDFVETAGSLAWIDELGCTFVGIDSQMIENHRWVGFYYPYERTELLEPIRHGTMTLAKVAHDMGARGHFNLDWGITQRADGSHAAMLIECNFRHNGFSHILNYSRQYLGGTPAPACLLTDNLTVPRGDYPLSELLAVLSDVRIDSEPILISRPGRQRGALVAMPPREGLSSLAIFGPSPSYAARVLAAAQDAVMGA